MDTKLPKYYYTNYVNDSQADPYILAIKYNLTCTLVMVSNYSETKLTILILIAKTDNPSLQYQLSV